MCQERNIHRARLTKGKFKAFLTIRYKGLIAEKLKNYFNSFFSSAMDFEYFCDLFERLMNPGHVDKV